MKDLQKAGGLSALITGLLLLTFTAMFVVVLPGQGFAGAEDLTNPAKVLPFAASSPTFSLLSLLDVVSAIFQVILVFALYERLQVGSPIIMRIATVSGLFLALFNLALGIIGFVAYSELSSLYPRNPAGAGAAYLAINSLLDALNLAGPFAYGWWALLASWVALRGGQLPKFLNYLGLLAGVVGIFAFALPILTIVGVVAPIVWFLWLGMVLLRTQAVKHEVAAPAST